MIGKFSCNELISFCHWFAEQTKQKSIHRSKVVNVGWIIELLVQLDKEGKLLEVLGTSGQAVADKAVAKPEGSGCDSVGQRGVDGGIVVALEAAGLELQLKDINDWLSQDNWKPLVVGDMLNQATDNLSCFLKQPKSW